MKIDEYMNIFKIDGKCFLLIAVAPKGEYPLRSYGNNFDSYVSNIFSTEKYIGIFDTDRKEILQDVAFKLFTMQLIGDKRDVPNSITIKKPRATSKEIISFFTIKEFMETVPHGEQNEEQAIANGKLSGEKFLKKYPISEFEIVISKHDRYEEGCQNLIDMEFNQENPHFYFNRVYVY